MPDYIEIEDPLQIDRLNKMLARNLKAALPFTERRTIGYPRGSFKAKIWFDGARGHNHFWWSPGESLGHNFFGHGVRGERHALNIDVQFNVAVEEFSRRLGGAFLKDSTTGSILLAHRGHVTLGHARIKKDALFSEMRATLRQAATSDGVREFLLIGELESAQLGRDLEEFATELRRTVRVIRDKRLSGVKTNPDRNGFSDLRDYFDEFWGRRNAGSRAPSIADCHHGKIVRALYDVLMPQFEQVQKSREIDLVARAKTSDLLFEVKTSVTPQAIYTAVGQLTVHSKVLAERESRKIRQVIVLPGFPHGQLRRALSRSLGIGVITYKLLGGKKVAFDGLTEIAE